MNDIKHTPLGIAMSAAIPLQIMGLKDKGGPSIEDLASLSKSANLLGEKGDVLLFGSTNKKDKGLCAKLFNETAKAVAILSFVPGGIDFFGQHYESSLAP